MESHHSEQHSTSLSTSSPILAIAGWSAIAILASLFVVKNVDLRVYWLGVNGFFSGTRPAYGPSSGLGFPMEYRYPPVTYLLLYPLRWCSLRTAGICWTMAAFANAAATLWVAVRIGRLRMGRPALVACAAYLVAYVVLAIRYANVQPFVIAWIFAALVLAESYPKWSGLLLALAVTFKIWPAMFVVLLIPRNRRAAVGWFGLWLVALWLLPILVFGPREYGALLADWYVAMKRVAETYSELYYFPSQSLRGILLRYLTAVPPPLTYFPRINFLAIAPATAVHIWMIVSPILYGSFVVWMLRSRAETLWAFDGLMFLVYSVVEPFAVKSGLISVAPAILVAGCLFTLGTQFRTLRAVRWANGLFLIACAISFGQALLQYKPWQRLLLTYGADFWGSVLLALAFILWIRSGVADQLRDGAYRRGSEISETLAASANWPPNKKLSSS